MNRYLFLLLFGAACCSTGLTAQSPAASLSIPATAFFMETEVERGYVLCPTGTGNLYVAGMKNVDMVLLEMTAEGAVVSSRYIDVGVTGLDAISQIIVDSDGHLVITGNLKEDQPDNGYVFRYDPVFRKTLWAKTFGGAQTLIGGVLENGPGGNFIVYANPHLPGGDDAEFFQLDRNTGNMIPGSAWRYNLGTSENFQSMVLHNGDLYAAGRFTDGFGSVAFSDMRHALLRIDVATGAPAWTSLSHIDPNEPGRLYGRGLVVEGDALVSVFSGNDAGDDLLTSHVFLQKNTLDGALVWVKKIDFPEWETEFAEEIISVPDGFVLYGHTLDGAALFLLKTNKNGELEWARKVEHTAPYRIIGTAQGQLVAIDNYLFATGFRDISGTSNMFLLKADANGTLSDNCPVFLPAPATAVDVSDAIGYPVTPQVDAGTTVAFDLPVAPPVNFIPQKQFVCQQIVSNCTDLPDLVFQADSIWCHGGGFRVKYTACNQGTAPVTGSFRVRFYPVDPTQDTTADMGSSLILLNSPLEPGTCISGMYNSLPWFAPGGLNGPQSVYFVVNDGGSLPTPFSFSDFPTTSLIECDYTNNLSSIAITLPDIPVLDLGPDVILCSDSVIVFDAGPGFLTYRWQNGSSGQMLTAADPGLNYWVEVTDVCGFEQRDSVFFSYSLLPDTKFGDTTICPGASVTYDLPGFTTYSWAPAAGLNCTDCPVVTASPVATTTYTLFANDTLGCELRDTFTVTVRAIPVLDLGPDVILCTDTTIVFDAGPGFLTYLWQDSTTSQMFTAADPGLNYWVEVTDVCGGIQRDSVFFSFSLLPDTKFGDTTICPGASVTYALPGFTTYSWAPAAGLNCTGCPVVTASPAATTTYTLFANDTLGCELRDTFTVTVRGPGNLSISCPANVTVQAASGAQTAAVPYSDPIANTDCLCGDAVWTLTQGLPGGANFPIGTTTVCFMAEDGCNASATCCFNVTVEKGPDTQAPCDVKETPCVRFEVLGVTQNPKKQKTYRMRVVNKCANELTYVVYQLPNGMTAKAPLTGSIYTSPAGRQYEVRNPNASPFHSIRFKTLGAGIANGQSDIFEYTLPAQADPMYIHTAVRLAPQGFVEAHLNVFSCAVEQTANRPDENSAHDRFGTQTTTEAASLRLFPNPVVNRLHIDLGGGSDQSVRLLVTDAVGRILLDSPVWYSEQVHALDIPQHWPSGMYFLTVTRADGSRAEGRFVK
ncbi:MAG: HYR domain-containing protein [Lewinellaceae bacterium]|nr:HYR domain-containing protein [Lewinellaceae bacterium]